MSDKKCSKCQGSGKMPNAPGFGCRYCGGSGKAVYKPVKKEGYGALDMSKDKKQAFKGAHWTVKFNESAEPQGRTPGSEIGIMELINQLKPDHALMFYGLTARQRVFVRKTGNGDIEIVDQENNEHRLNPRADNTKIKLVARQLAALHRRLNLYKIISTISTRPSVSPPESMKKSELKEIIQELVQEMWTDTGTHPTEPDLEGGEGEEDGVKPTGRLTAAGSDKFVDLYKGNKEGPPSSLPSVGGAMSENKHPLSKYLDGPDGEEDLSKQTERPRGINVYDEAYPGDTWNPQTFIKTPEEVSTLIFGLSEGEGITFMSDKQGRSTDWVAVEKTVEGDEYVYKHFTYRDQGNKHYLETDEDVLDLATEIAKNPRLTLYALHEVTTSDGRAYRKQPRELYEAKGMNAKDKLRMIIREVIEEIHDETDMSNPEESREVQIATEIKNLADSLPRDHTNPYVNHIQKIIKLADELIKMHEKSSSLKKQGVLKRSLQYKHGKPVDGMNEVAPKGWEGTVKAMKKHKDIDNPWALANWMKGKGMKSHK